ncbi:MAG TPA: hypothetical protein VK781_10805 [Solirubrobacteraceae bacterium]|nr:hypothetical protein [Solirubrobacteraceae bacterium]
MRTKLLGDAPGLQDYSPQWRSPDGEATALFTHYEPPRRRWIVIGILRTGLTDFDGLE